jgi:hypothetical protein
LELARAALAFFLFTCRSWPKMIDAKRVLMLKRQRWETGRSSWATVWLDEFAECQQSTMLF